jgi:hypothetical protein
MKNPKKIVKTSFIGLILVIVVICTLFYLFEQGDRKRTEVGLSRQELSKRLMEVCTPTPKQCPKNTQELEVFEPDLYKSSNRYSPLKYTYDPTNNHWQLVVNFNGAQVAVHDSTSENVKVGELYSLETAREKGLYP